MKVHFLAEAFNLASLRLGIEVTYLGPSRRFWRPRPVLELGGVLVGYPDKKVGDST